MKSYITRSLIFLLTTILSFAVYVIISNILIHIVSIILPFSGFAFLVQILIIAYGFCFWLAFLILRFRKKRTPRKENL